MPSAGLIGTFAREVLVSRSLPREPEPDLGMEGDEQVAAYAAAGRVDGVMGGGYLFRSAREAGTRNVR